MLEFYRFMVYSTNHWKRSADNMFFLLLITIWVIYCKFTIIYENFIFTYIHEFDNSQIQHSRICRIYIRKCHAYEF